MSTRELSTRVVAAFHPRQRRNIAGREVTAGQMSRHLAYYPQCSLDMERSGRRRDDDGRRRKRRKKLYRVPSDHLSAQFENAKCVDADSTSEGGFMKSTPGYEFKNFINTIFLVLVFLN